MNDLDKFEWDQTLNAIWDEIVSSPKKKIITEGEFAWRGEGEQVSYIPVSVVTEILDKHKKFFIKKKETPTPKQQKYIDWIEAYVDVSFEKSGMTIKQYIDTYAPEAHKQFELDGVVQESING